MTKLLSAVAALACLGLAACSGPVETLSQSSDATMVRYSSDARSNADSQAEQSCNQYGKKARLRSNHSEGDTRQTAIYDCVPR